MFIRHMGHSIPAASSIPSPHDGLLSVLDTTPSPS
jgi:hypothetical protein